MLVTKTALVGSTASWSELQQSTIQALAVALNKCGCWDSTGAVGAGAVAAAPLSLSQLTGDVGDGGRGDSVGGEHGRLAGAAMQHD